MKIIDKAKEFLTIAPPRPRVPVDLKGQNCEVLLESGGKITLSIDADLMKLSTIDYNFALKMIEDVRGYKPSK